MQRQQYETDEGMRGRTVKGEKLDFQNYWRKLGNLYNDEKWV